jgi:hypothetical protein
MHRAIVDCLEDVSLLHLGVDGLSLSVAQICDSKDLVRRVIGNLETDTEHGRTGGFRDIVVDDRSGRRRSLSTLWQFLEISTLSDHDAQLRIEPLLDADVQYGSRRRLQTSVRCGIPSLGSKVAKTIIFGVYSLSAKQECMPGCLYESIRA